MVKKMVTSVKVKKIRSTIGCEIKTKKIMTALGFPSNCNIGKTVSHKLTPQIQGMLNLVSHLIEKQDIQ